MRKLTVFLLVTLFLCGCYVVCHNDPGFFVVFPDYAQNEIKVVIEKQFAKNTNFSVPNKITIWVDTISQWSSVGDTSYAPFPYSPYNSFKIDKDYDYIIEVPGISKSFQIKNISTHTITGGYPGSDWNCTNAADYYVNDTLHHYAGEKPAKHSQSGSVNVYLYQ